MAQPSDPLELYDALLNAGNAPTPEAFCEAFPDRPDLLARVLALLDVRKDLVGMAHAMEPPLLPKSLFAGCRIVALLDQGGMGAVYVATDVVSEEPVVLKILRHATPTSIERLMREARLLQTLDHPNIAKVLRTGSEKDRPFIVVEMVRGVTLREMLREGPGAKKAAVLGLKQIVKMPPLVERVDMCVDMAHQVALALEHAHQRGVIHRDVKPSNIMVTHDTRIKLIDFGIAREVGDVQHLTATGVFVGTPAYAAPEQLDGDRQNVGPWTDTFALGVTLYEMLGSRQPFASDDPERVVTPVKPSRYNKSVPRALDSLVMHAMRATRSKRFQNGTEMAEEFLKIRR